MALIDSKIDVLKIPKDKLFKGEKGTYLDFKVAEMREADQYGNTHTIYIQKEKGDEKVYLGKGKLIEFNRQEQSDTGINGLGQSDDLPF